MTDRYARIRAALAMGPTPGPWEPSYDKGSTRDIITQKEKYPICMVRGIAYVGQDQYLANSYFIAACDPDTIRALLKERDELQQSFDLHWRASMRAIKRWQEAHPGSDLTWPDHADLVVWLLEQLDAAREAEGRSDE